MRSLLPFVMGLLAACGSSHTEDDATADARGDASMVECPGPEPTGCIIRGDGCCDRVPARCEGGVWICEQEGSGGPSCEGPCGTAECTDLPPTCYRDGGDGCCGEMVEPICAFPVTSCPSGSLRAHECAAMAPECTPDLCGDLTEEACIGDPACVPLYDDFCCPSCVPIGACADCTRPQMYRCAPIDEACSGAACGATSPDHCAGDVPDCSSANVVSGFRCDVVGCVAAVPAGCTDDCPMECVPVRPGMCDVFCGMVEPDCPAGTVAETDGTCYTNRCVAPSVCQVATTPAP